MDGLYACLLQQLIHLAVINQRRKNPRRLTTFPFFFCGSRSEYKDWRTWTIGGFLPSRVSAYM